MKALPFDFGSSTDIGLVREMNQDAMGFYEVGGGHLLVVADGMGGLSAGEEASKMAVEKIYESFKSLSEGEDVAQRVIQAIAYANEAIYQRATSYKTLMGTTVVVAFLTADQITIGHVGDSRAYRYRPETGLQLLTKDHSTVQEMVNQGFITEEQAQYHPRRNEITRSVGTRPEVLPDVQQHPLQPGDTFILLTDGISALLTSQQIQEIVADKTLSAQQKAQKLVDTANDLGGYDNSTVQIISYPINPPQPESTPKQEENTPSAPKSSTHPKSSTQDSPIRYYLFIAGSVITISLLLYYGLAGIATSAAGSKNSVLGGEQDSLRVQKTMSIEAVDSVSQNHSAVQPEAPAQLIIEYKVRPGQSLNRLAQLFNFPVDSIKKMNELEEDELRVNQVLRMPIQALHQVQKGDKITLLAQRYKVKKNQIIALNRMKNSDKLKVGDKLYIPLPRNH